VYDGVRRDRRDNGVKTEAEWGEEAKRALRAEMIRRGVTYDQLAEKLAAIGLVDSPVNIRNKVARGKFTAVFLMQCLEAMGCRVLRLSEGEGEK
jgi:microsomal dipeptidase-like Zn-dependent dipeptidase